MDNKNVIFQNKFLRVESESFEIPWVKIFTIEPFKEFSECSSEIRVKMLDMIYIIEKEMIAYFNPDKINIASFGNYLPRVHFHIQARFENDSYFPESTWGLKMRTTDLQIDCESFFVYLKDYLKGVFYES